MNFRLFFNFIKNWCTYFHIYNKTNCMPERADEIDWIDSQKKKKKKKSLWAIIVLFRFLKARVTFASACSLLMRQWERLNVACVQSVYMFNVQHTKMKRDKFRFPWIVLYFSVRWCMRISVPCILLCIFRCRYY